MTCLKCLFSGKPELKSEVDVLVADVSDPDSLAAMCKQAVIVLSCVGPVSTPTVGHRIACVWAAFYMIAHKTLSY